MEPKPTELPDSIVTMSAAVKWFGDSLTESPGALAILASVPPGFSASQELDDFYAGVQWSPAVERDRQAKRRPVLVVNMLPTIAALAIRQDEKDGIGFGLTNIQMRVLRAFIAARNRDAQMAFNYMVSSLVEMTANEVSRGQVRLISPDQLAERVREAFVSTVGTFSPGPEHEVWVKCGMAAVEYFLEQPRV